MATYSAEFATTIILKDIKDLRVVGDDGDAIIQKKRFPFWWSTIAKVSGEDNTIHITIFNRDQEFGRLLEKKFKAKVHERFTVRVFYE